MVVTSKYYLLENPELSKCNGSKNICMLALCLAFLEKPDAGLFDHPVACF
jgi:hypothetical protein